MPDDDGLVAFAEPGPEDNSASALFLVAEVDDEIVGHLYARVIAPVDSDRFQSISDLRETRLVIEALAVLQTHWRRGVASALVENAEAWGRERGATSRCAIPGSRARSRCPSGSSACTMRVVRSGSASG
jgi:GNAT superfamily N-acetyltransferase